jgi:hypothetical protein
MLLCYIIQYNKNMLLLLSFYHYTIYFQPIESPKLVLQKLKNGQCTISYIKKQFQSRLVTLKLTFQMTIPATPKHETYKIIKEIVSKLFL